MSKEKHWHKVAKQLWPSDTPEQKLKIAWAHHIAFL